MKKRIKTGLEYRKSKGLFISKAIEYKNTTAIEKLFTLLGVPLLIDKNDELFADVALFPLLAPIAIFNSLFSESGTPNGVVSYIIFAKNKVYQL